MLKCLEITLAQKLHLRAIYRIITGALIVFRSIAIQRLKICINRNRIDILSMQYPELLMLTDSMKLFVSIETGWGNKADGKNVIAIYCLN